MANRPDETDIHIMRLLQSQARMPISQISREVNMSQPAVKERILKLEEQGIIKGYSATIDPARIDRSATTFILLKTELCDALVHYCEQSAAVTDLYRIGGEYNYLLKVRGDSIEELTEFQESLVQFGPSKSYVSMKNIMENRVVL